MAKTNKNQDTEGQILNAAENVFQMKGIQQAVVIFFL